jgi:hypothetical protein
MRSPAPFLALALACTPSPGAAPQAPRGLDDEVRSDQGPISADDLARLDAAAAARGALYWRVRTPAGPRCEAWTFEPDAEDPRRGRIFHVEGAAAPGEQPVPEDTSEESKLKLELLRVPTASDVLPEGASRYSFNYQVVEQHLRLTGPTRERDTPVAPAPPTPDTRVATGTMTRSLAFPCVFTGQSLAPADPGAARQIVLGSNERWFFSEADCAAAGPDVDPLVATAGEIHPLGCASALADASTRGRDAGPAGPALARLRAAKRVFLLRSRGGVTACEVWRHRVSDPQLLEGSLTRDDRDEHGARTLRYDYAALGDSVTLLGPHEFRRLRVASGRADLTSTRGCLFARPLALRGEALQVGEDAWFLDRRTCERARRAGAVARPDLDCRPGPARRVQPSR